MRILIISDHLTHPINAGNKCAIWAQCQILRSLGHEIFFLYIYPCFSMKDNFNENEVSMTREAWSNNFFTYKVPFFKKIFPILWEKFFSPRFYYKSDTLYPGGLHKYVNKLNNVYHFDACIVNYYWLTKIFEYINIPKKACYTHDCFSFKDLLGGEKAWRRTTPNEEAKALQRCTDVFAIQEEEFIYFRILSPLNNHYNVYSKYDYHPQAIQGNKNIVFLSGKNIYNQNGLKWFLDDVFPLIKLKHPDAKLLIAGGICKTIKGLYDNIEGVEFKGYVENPGDFYALGDVAINPTYQGTGLKIKTFEAIAYDKVAMVHPHSTTGIYKKESAPLFVSNKPEEWVEYLDYIWNHPEKVQQIKRLNQSYLEEMNNFIINEYKRFLEY